MASKTEVYIDTSALIAALDRSDNYHAAYARLFGDPPPLLTSALVIAEGHGWFLRRYDSRKATEFLRFTEALHPFTIVSFGQNEVSSVLTIVRKFGGQNLTLADAHGLAVMRERRIRVCWSTDRHLSLTGVKLVN